MRNAFIGALVFFITCLSCLTACEEQENLGVINATEDCYKFNINIPEWKNEFLEVDSITTNFSEFNGVDELYVNFECKPNIFFKHPKILLNKNTSSGEMMKLFPESFKLIRSVGNSWSGKVEVFATPWKANPVVWVFYFEREKLPALAALTGSGNWVG